MRRGRSSRKDSDTTKVSFGQRVRSGASKLVAATSRGAAPGRGKRKAARRASAVFGDPASLSGAPGVADLGVINPASTPPVGTNPTGANPVVPEVEVGGCPSPENTSILAQSELGDKTVLREDYPLPAIAPIVIGKEKPQPFESRYVDIEKFSSLRYIPDTILDGWENDFLALRGASVRGRSHRWEGTPRQDNFATVFIPQKNWVVAAVADGVSGAPQSHIGASVAISSAINYFLKTETTEIEQLNWRDVCETIAQDMCLMTKLLPKASEGFSDSSGANAQGILANAALKYLATTFVCALITRKQGEDSLTAHIIALGDSGVWLLAHEGFRPLAGGKDDSAEITANDVEPLPYLPEVTRPVEVKVKPGEVLLLGTDGIGEPLGSGDGELGQLFKTLLKRVPSLIDFAHAVDFTRKYFVDDRALIAIWPKGTVHDTVS